VASTAILGKTCPAPAGGAFLRVRQFDAHARSLPGLSGEALESPLNPATLSIKRATEVDSGNIYAAGSVSLFDCPLGSHCVHQRGTRLQ